MLQKPTYPRIQPAHFDAHVVLDMPFDEGAGDRVLDYSGHNNHGTLMNMTEADWVSGVGGRGRALEFDGVNDYVEANGAAAGGVFGGNFTMAGWGKLASWGGNRTVFGAGMTVVTTPYAEIDFSNATQRIHARTQRGVPINSVQSLLVYTNDSDEHHFTMVGNASGHIAAFYIDAVYQGADVTNAFDLSPIERFLVGQLPYNIPNVNPWHGKVSEVIIFDRILTASEVLRLYEQSRARYRIG